MCIECTKSYHRTHYQNNKDAYASSRDAHRQRVKIWLRELKEAGTCLDCGIKYHYSAMHFHHLDPTLKDEGISRLVNYSRGRIEKEIEKCELLCANCHAVRTWSDDGVVT